MPIVSYSKICEHLCILNKDINSSTIYDHTLVMLSNLEMIKISNGQAFQKSSLKDLWEKLEKIIKLCQQFKGNNYCDNLMFKGINTNNREISHTNLWMYKPYKLLNALTNRLTGITFFLFDYKPHDLWNAQTVTYGTKTGTKQQENLAKFSYDLIKIYNYFDKKFCDKVKQDLEVYNELFTYDIS
jgi:hypothetical protein